VIQLLFGDAAERGGVGVRPSLIPLTDFPTFKGEYSPAAVISSKRQEYRVHMGHDLIQNQSSFSERVQEGCVRWNCLKMELQGMPRGRTRERYVRWHLQPPG
jgi:hypothetical protein